MISLSYSRINDYITCPYKFKEKYLDKSYPDESANPAFTKGKNIHDQIDKYIQATSDGKTTKAVSPILNDVKELIDTLHSHGFKISTELQLAVDDEWNKCGWFGNPKFRAIVDALIFPGDGSAVAIDWKTGKFRPYEDSAHSQLKLTAAMIMNIFPDVHTVVCKYIFVEHRKMADRVFTRNNLESIMKPFDDIFVTVNEDEKFVYKKNRYCNWCLSTSCPMKK